MPLHHGYSKSVVGENVATEVRGGRPVAQAVAMALRSARTSYRARHPKGAFPKHLKMTSTHRSMRSLSPHVVVGVGDGRNRAGNLPQWTGASHVYSYLYKVLEQLGAEEWSRIRAAAKKRGRKPHGIGPTDEMKDIIKALERGDEETLKAIQMKYKLDGSRNREGAWVTTNSNGLSFSEWLAAAGGSAYLQRREGTDFSPFKAWQQGEDPSEYRGSRNRTGDDGDYVLVYGGAAGRGFAVSNPFALKKMAIDEARSLSRQGSYGGEVRVGHRVGGRVVEVGRARDGQFHATEKSANRAIQSVGDPEPETKSYYAAMIDETEHINKEVLVKGTPFKASQVDKVYEVVVFTLDERVHLASLTPSTYYEPIYYIITGKDGYFPEDDEEREKWHEMEDELLQEAESGSYFDHSYAQKIAKRDKSHVKNIGDFESFDDAREHAQGNYPF